MSPYSPLLDVYMGRVDHWTVPRQWYHTDTRNANDFLNMWMVPRLTGGPFYGGSRDTYTPGASCCTRDRPCICIFRTKIYRCRLRRYIHITSELWGYCSKTFEDYKHLLDRTFVHGHPVLQRDQCICTCACSNNGRFFHNSAISSFWPVPSTGFEHSRFLATFARVLCSTESDTTQEIYEALASVVIRAAPLKNWS